MASTVDNFRAEIDSFLERSKMSPSAFGKAAVNDPNFVRDIREKDRSPSLKLVDKVHAFIKASEFIGGGAE